MREGILMTSAARPFSLDEIRTAVTQAEATGRQGKILLVPQKHELRHQRTGLICSTESRDAHVRFEKKKVTCSAYSTLPRETLQPPDRLGERNLWFSHLRMP